VTVALPTWPQTPRPQAQMSVWQPPFEVAEQPHWPAWVLQHAVARPLLYMQLPTELEGMPVPLLALHIRKVPWSLHESS
jgi:hypothetical protein